MCNRYTPGDSEHPHYRARLAINAHAHPAMPRRRIGPWQVGGFFANAPNKSVDWKVGQWGLIRPSNPRRWDYVGKPAEIEAKLAAGKEPQRRSTNNARSETMRKSPVFGPAWRANRRCIIPAVSFDEPCHEPEHKGWWEFQRSDGQPWGVAGLWNEWIDHATGEIVPNYTMVTVNADDHELMRRMHRPEFEADGKTLKVPQDKRGILVLEPSDWEAWLFGSQDEALGLLKLPPPSIYDGGLIDRKPQQQSLV